jgi:hypothetical protein
MSAWTDFVKTVMKRDGITYKEALQKASGEYKKEDKSAVKKEDKSAVKKEDKSAVKKEDKSAVKKDKKK